MTRKQDKNKPEDSDMGLVKTVLFEPKKDDKLLQLVNTYASLRPAFKPKSLIREILLEVLPERIRKIQESNQQTITA